MLKEEELAVLRDIAQLIAFADDMKGEVDRLIKEGYVSKDGDLYELTPKAEKALQIAVRVSMRDNTQNEDGPDIDCNAASFIASPSTPPICGRQDKPKHRAIPSRHTTLLPSTEHGEPAGARVFTANCSSVVLSRSITVAKYMVKRRGPLCLLPAAEIPVLTTRKEEAAN
jgi:hypothetical protein